MANTTTAAPAALTPRVTPTVSQSVRIDFGSWVTQIYAHEEPVLEALAAVGIHLALAQVPLGTMVEHWIGPNVIHQYAEMAKVALGGATGGLVVDVPADGYYGYVANLLNHNEAAMLSFLGDKVDPLIKAALAKVGISV